MSAISTNTMPESGAAREAGTAQEGNDRAQTANGRAQLMGGTPIPRLILKFSLPTIVGMLVNALYNIVDVIYIGNIEGIGEICIAALSINAPIMLAFFSFMMMAGVGGAARISIYLGEEKKDLAERTIGNGIVLITIITATLATAAACFMEPLLTLFGASPNTMQYAKDYLSIILIGVPVNGFGYCLNRYIMAQGLPKISMTTMLIGAITNIILDPIFIFVLGMGVRGAAIATIIAQTFSCAWCAYYFFSGRTPLKIRAGYLRLQISVVFGIVSIGVASFFMQISASLVRMVLNKSLLHYGGDAAVSILGLIFNVSSIFLMPMIGINQGIQPIVGFNYGALKYNRVKEAIKAGVLASTSFAIIGYLVIMLFPTEIAMVFGRENHNILHLAPKAFRTYLFFTPMIGIAFVSTIVFQAIDKPRLSLFMSLLRQVIVLIPATLVLPIFFGLEGIFLSGAVADFISSVTAAALLTREVRKLNHLIAGQGKLQKSTE